MGYVFQDRFFGQVLWGTFFEIAFGDKIHWVHFGEVSFGLMVRRGRFWGIISQIHFPVAQIALNIKRDETPPRRYSDRPFSRKTDSRPTSDCASRPFFRAIPV